MSPKEGWACEKVLRFQRPWCISGNGRQTDSQLAGLQEQGGECRATEGQKQAEAICLLAKLWGFLAFKMFPFPGDLPDPGIEPESVDSLPLCHLGSPNMHGVPLS